MFTKRIFFLLLVLFGGIARVHATHNIAGEITVECINGIYHATITTYTNSQSNADRCELTLEWGDGTSSVLLRSGGPPATNCPSPATGGNPISGYPNTQVNTYSGTHSYPGPGVYVLRMKDPNRVAGIDNIQNSVNTAFYIETKITISPLFMCNSTPVFTTIPLDRACVNHCFYHSPGAVDPDNDSLSYSIGPPLDTTGLPFSPFISVMPDAPCTSNTPHGAGGTMTIDPVTGILSWCSPTCQGKFNVDVYVHEWKKIGNTYVNVGYVIREMQIDVATCNNNNPDIPDLPDLCVDAGSTVNFNFVVTDPDNDAIELTTYGTAFTATPPAVLTPSGAGIYSQQPVATNFSWSPTCDNVRLQPFTVTIKARDNDILVPLLDIETFRIRVVSPGPVTLTASPTGTSMLLNWTPNPCNAPSNPCLGYKIYRKVGASGWNPAQCETGVPTYTGFVYVGTVVGFNNTTFVDNNNGSGLIPGLTYCYRVHAYFVDGSESYASPEDCNELRRDVPIISHVDVVTTDGSNGQIGVSWYNAIADAQNFDTIARPGPYQLKIYRSTGFTMPNTPAPALITTLTSQYFANLPDTFTDNNSLNTIGTPYCYRIAFIAGGGTDSIGSSQPASSVFLSSTPADNVVNLTWTEVVPWTNFRYEIYRKLPSSSVFSYLDTTSAQHYADSNLVNGSNYCYYVRSLGTYNNPNFPDTLRNRSQEICQIPQDLTPPCAPQLGVNSDCFNYINQLIWTNPMNMNCGTDDVVSYNIWFTPTEGGPWQLLATITNPSDTTFLQQGLASVAGCYAITALDTFNNQSAYSNIFCVDNCPVYELPNVFSPNGDNINDQFIPFPYRYVESVDLKIYDRWGVLVYETTDPAVRWNGRSEVNGRLCSDGVYYYVCTVNEIRLQGIVPRVLTGFVHLFGDNKKAE